MTNEEEQFGRELFGKVWDSVRKDEDAEWRSLYRAIKVLTE